MEGFARLMHTPLGYDPHNIVSVGVPLHKNAFPAWAARAAYFEQLRSERRGDSRRHHGSDLKQRNSAAQRIEPAI